MVAGVFLFQGCGSEQYSGYDTGGDLSPDGSPDSAQDVQQETGETVFCNPYECNRLCIDMGYLSGGCKDSVNCAECSEAPPPAETCGDGIDNNGNGAIDENCSCATGDVQYCYSGPQTVRNVGACIEGFQNCEGTMEFLHWGACIGEVLPTDEICADFIDNNCDTVVDEYCEVVCYPIEFGVETICNNGIDDDCDGLIDCADPDCSCCTPMPEICSDGIDNDCDGRKDCWDLMDCMINPPPEDCHNGIDDDCDRYADCDDTDCCSEPECFDPSKCGLPCCIPGTQRWCDDPSYCHWGKQVCGPDSHWGTCEETADRPPGCDASVYYYDRECCLAAGACCMNYPYDDTSVGNCGGIAVDCP